MAYPSKFKRLEAEHGKPVAEILVNKLNEHDGKIALVAKDLDITYAKLYDKIQECGLIKTPARWSLPEAEHAE